MGKSTGSLLILILISFDIHGEEWQLRGRVVDEAGQPVAGAMVDHFWRGNGKQVRPDGSPFDLTKEDEVRLLWGNVGQMEPLRGATTIADGSFSLDVSRRRHAVMAMDAARKRGGLVIVSNGQEDSRVEIRLQPMVKVRGRFVGPEAGKTPCWTITRARIPEDPARPVDNFWIAQCGSFESGFELLLPPGNYTLDASGQSMAESSNDVVVSPAPTFTVNKNVSELDLGVLSMTRQIPSFRHKQIERATAESTWGDYKKHYGQQPPKWHVVDARGVRKDVQLSDYRGKWVLVNFWGLPCPHCLADDLPRLTKFYEDHAFQRDKFEILAFCMDCDSGLKSISDLDKALEPIVNHLWNGKRLPFPVLLDPSFTTMERYGFRAYGTMLLIDPDGKLIEGDDKTLAERLRE